MSGRIEKIAVIGAGRMGHGIAQVAAMAGYAVNLVDVDLGALERALNRIRWSLGKLADKGVVEVSEVERILGKIRISTEIAEAVEDVDLAIESVPEDFEIKRKVLAKIDENSPQHTIISTNTSTIPITELASATNRSDKFIGIHFFNPPQLVKLVEIIPGETTSEETVRIAEEFVKSLKKEVLICRKDLPAFVVNRVLFPILDEAAWMVKRGEAEIAEIDSAIKYRVGLPMGPFELMDYIGLDVVYSAMREVKKRDPKLILLCPLIKEYYERGWWGRASGKGFYEYLGEGAGRVEIPRELSENVDPLTILAPSANIIARLVKLGAASLQEINWATKLALGFPKGIMECFREAGYQKVVEELKRKMAYDPEYYKPDEYLGEIFKIKGEEVKVGLKEVDRIVLHRKPPVAWIILNRPEKLNALTSEMMEDLDEILKSLEGDDEIRVVVIKGAGETAFSVGADVNLFKGLSRGEAERESKRWKEIIDDIESFPKPIIAAIKGYCFGCGLEIALACDFRLASSNSMLGQPEIRLGLIPGAGGTQRLVKLIGLGRAKELLMLGKKVSAEEAERIGLVNMVFPPEDFDRKVEEFALNLAEGPPIAFSLLKHAINLAGSYRIEDGYRFESEAFGKLFETEDLREGIDAFLSKRKPRFRGR